METMQLQGPFEKDEQYLFDVAGASYVQIGVEIDNQLPMIIDEDLEPNFKINGTKLRISDNSLLEWDISETELSIVPLQNFNAYTLINVGYE